MRSPISCAPALWRQTKERLLLELDIACEYPRPRRQKPQNGKRSQRFSAARFPDHDRRPHCGRMVSETSETTAVFGDATKADRQALDFKDGRR